MLRGLRDGAWAKSGGGWVNPYVTDGLVAMWDGEWNAGGGVHDADATVWKDIAGNKDLTINSNFSEVFDNYLKTSGCSAGDKAAYNNGFIVAKTIELVRYYPAGELSHHLYFYTGDGGRGIGSYGGGWITFGVNNSRGNSTFKSGIRTNAVQAISAVYYEDGKNECEVFSYGTKYTGGSTLYGSSLNPDGMIQIASYNAVRTYCIRLYSKTLTSSEIAANYAIDKARFGLP